MALLAFDAARQQIEVGCARVLSGVEEPARNAVLPEVSLMRGKTTVDLVLRELEKTAVFTVLETIGPYYKALNELRKTYGGVSFVCDLYSDFDRRRAVRPRIGAPATDAAPEQPPPVECSCRFERDGGARISFEKKADLAQEELNSIVDLFTKLAVRDVAASPAIDPGRPADRDGRGRPPRERGLHRGAHRRVRVQRSEVTAPPLEQYVEAFQLKFAGRLPATHDA